LLSIRPLFQTVAFLYIILGPLSALSGTEQYIFNYGSKEFYWLLYLGAPLAFLGYELGYAGGLGRSGNRLQLPVLDFQVEAMSRLAAVIAFAVVVVLFIYMASRFGLTGYGFDMQAITASGGEAIKDLCLVYNSFMCLAVGAVIINLCQEKLS
jgi:hypothetical protein